MHELGLMENTLAVVFEQARQMGAEKVLGVRMRVGTMSGVAPDALEFAFEALTGGTAAEGARLQIDKVPVACYCDRCRIEFEPAEFSFECPACKSPSSELRRGRELEIVSFEVP